MTILIQIIAPFVVVPFNRLLAAGHFPAGFREAFLTPIGKKPGLDIMFLRVETTRTPRQGRRPAERLFNVRLSTIAAAVWFLTRTFDRNCCLAKLQVLFDILQAVNCGNSAAPLDLSAAFDTVDHEILLQRLRVTLGIHDRVHRWFQSYVLG